MKITRTIKLANSGGLAVALLAASALPAAAGGAMASKPAPPPASVGALADDGVDSVDTATVLLPYAELVRALPGRSGHDYKYDTNRPFWSAVAVKPVGRADVDLMVYDDQAHVKLLAKSEQGGAGATDFVAVDSNHRPYGGYFPHVTKESGSGTYRVELAQGNSTFDDDDETVAVSSTDVVIVRDTWLAAGKEYVFGVGGPPGVVLYLMKSEQSFPFSWVQPRAAAIRKTPTTGFQIFDFTPAHSDWYGVVVTLPGTAGEVTMIRETVDD
jgi:hypothetical protein